MNLGVVLRAGSRAQSPGLFIQSLHSCELPQVSTQEHTADAGSEVSPFAQLDGSKEHVRACCVLGKLCASRDVGVDEDNPGHQSGAPLPREQQGIFADNCSRYGHLEIKG